MSAQPVTFQRPHSLERSVTGRRLVADTTTPALAIDKLGNTMTTVSTHISSSVEAAIAVPQSPVSSMPLTAGVYEAVGSMEHTPALMPHSPAHLQQPVTEVSTVNGETWFHEAVGCASPHAAAGHRGDQSPAPPPRRPRAQSPKSQASASQLPHATTATAAAAATPAPPQGAATLEGTTALLLEGGSSLGGMPLPTGYPETAASHSTQAAMELPFWQSYTYGSPSWSASSVELSRDMQRPPPAAASSAAAPGAASAVGGGGPPQQQHPSLQGQGPSTTRLSVGLPAQELLQYHYAGERGPALVETPPPVGAAGPAASACRPASPSSLAPSGHSRTRTGRCNRVCGSLAGAASGRVAALCPGLHAAGGLQEDSETE